MKLKGKVAIITGASRGIGEAIARAFAVEGANIVLVSRHLSEVEDTASKIKAFGRSALALKADVTIKENVAYVMNSTVEEFGKIDILVNNAGIQGTIGPLVDNDVDLWIETININLIGTFLCIKTVLPLMIQRRSGKIINLSGGGASSPRPNFSAYAASKVAVVRITETVAAEVKDFNIQINAIAPGAVNTRMLKQVLMTEAAAGEKALADAKHQLETGGTPPEKAAALAVFLASDESNGLTGRLISAAWDDWLGMIERIPEIMSSDLFTLRRIIPEGSEE